ncbi:MAG: hypothetical protein H6662_06670 [Ardenticatenaceae bacterium]|nr:hypothetical protein [Anaerolineales bacterium]MCB8921248.1 hypothetical protein [Ardenticatenaceae bacterium]MCB8990614.1 hypothetical protein [Ardenticatenaceae bacterium]MCB9004321.1 hypothetical protein [Ardenticatenaceae bacterium]
MDTFKNWWRNELPVGVKFVLLVLLANGLPAFVILMTMPGQTENFFVWTINPVINARLIGVMYGNALLLVAFAAFQKSWATARVMMVVITLFSVMATALTFFFLKPFLAHPWFHLAYWLTMYFILFFAAPFVFVTHERKYGGKLPVQLPLTGAARILAAVSLIISLVCGLSLIFAVDVVNQILPWSLPPLVGGLIGVLFITHTAAYAWALWDGDWLRVRPIFWQAPPTGLLLFLLPLTHPSDLNEANASNLGIYLALTALFVLLYLGVILSYRRSVQGVHSYGS